MKPGLARVLVGLYPRPWRQRYGEELESLLVGEGNAVRAAMDIVLSAAKERLSPTCSPLATPVATPLRVVVKQPSAILPLSISLVALTVVLAHAAIFGVVHEKDEGAAAHLWQLLVAGAFSASIFFAIRWMPKAARQTLIVLLFICVLMLANFAAVYFLT